MVDLNFDGVYSYVNGVYSCVGVLYCHFDGVYSCVDGVYLIVGMPYLQFDGVYLIVGWDNKEGFAKSEAFLCPYFVHTQLMSYNL